MKTIIGIEAGIVAVVVVLLWVTAPGGDEDGPPQGDGPMLTMTVENGEPVHRPLWTPRAVVTPYVLGAGAFLAVAVPFATRARGRRREDD